MAESLGMGMLSIRASARYISIKKADSSVLVKIPLGSFSFSWQEKERTNSKLKKTNRIIEIFSIQPTKHEPRNYRKYPKVSVGAKAILREVAKPQMRSYQLIDLCVLKSERLDLNFSAQ
jgi:hypothetical protein